MFVPTEAVVAAILAFTNAVEANGKIVNTGPVRRNGAIVPRQEAVTVTVTDTVTECGVVPSEPSTPEVPIQDTTAEVTISVETSVPVPTVETTESVPVPSVSSTTVDETTSVHTTRSTVEVSTESTETTPSTTETPEASTTSYVPATDGVAPLKGEYDNALFAGAVGLAAMLAL